jgi:hypothetical protein
LLLCATGEGPTAADVDVEEDIKRTARELLGTAYD